jgi:hypothetical protein
VNLRVQAIEKLSMLWALPPITDAAALTDGEYFIKLRAKELGES